jgi:2-hydroxymuconate-semialdehyde hydrolase
VAAEQDALAGSMLEVGGIPTRVHEAGEGPPVVLVHGSGPGVSAWANWSLTLPVLARRFHVVAADAVGFGDTTAPEHFSFDRSSWTRHLLELIDTLGLERVSVVGNSFGGALALSLAAAHPDRVNRLVLMGSVGVAFPITPGLDAVWGCEPTEAALREVMPLFAFDRSRLTDELVARRAAAAAQPAVAASYAAMFPAPRQRWVDGLALDERQIGALPHETLIVHGRDDQVIPLDNSSRLHRLIDRSDLHVFGRCGHWVQIEAADRFTRLVGDFLEHGLGDSD